MALIHLNEALERVRLGGERDSLAFVGIDFEAIFQEEPIEPVKVRLEYVL